MFKETISAEELEKMDYASFEGKIRVVDSVGSEFNRAVAYLRKQRILGFDTETRPTFSPCQPHHDVALLQLSGRDKAYLFRLNKMGMPYRLCSLLSDKRIVKVGAAVHDDIRGLQKLRDFEPAGFMDLQRLSSEWGIKDKSVKKMAGIILGIRISKTQQLSNWEADRLSEPQIKYAATDAWVCREMFIELMSNERPVLEDVLK